MSSNKPLPAALVRRDFFKTLGAAALPLLAQGCDSGEDEAVAFRGGPKGPKGPPHGHPHDPEDPAPPPDDPETAQVQIHRAWLEQVSLIGYEQHCSLPATLSNIVNVGDQIRVIRNQDEYALYTVDHFRNDDDPEIVRMALEARLRLGTSDTFAGTLSTAITAPDLNDAQAKTQGEFVERLVDDGQNTGLVVIAPHGGMIEVHTDDQAEWVQQSLPGASSWICKGWRPGGGAFERWHITSTRLSPNSFTGLGAIADRGFAYAVSFHGMPTGGVVIGGAAPLELKQVVRDAIVAELGDATIEVNIATSDDLFNGDAPENVVNWLTAGGSGGLQIEQGRDARASHWQAIAQAVVEVYAQLI